MLDWNPYTSYTWTRKQVKQWIATNGESSFYDGILWTIKARHIAAGMYAVRFVQNHA